MEVNPHIISESRIPAHVNVTCHTEVSDGKPEYRILYNHGKIRRRSPEKSYDEEYMGYHYTSTWTEVISVVDAGLVTCEVEDQRGLYIAERNIVFIDEATYANQELSTVGRVEFTG